MDNDSTTVYYAHQSSLPKLRTVFERIARRAAKLGMTAPTFTEHARYDEIVKRREDELSPVRTFVFPKVVLTVDGGLPKLKGWTILAAIEHVDGETLIHAFDATADLSMYRASPNACEHCRTDRRRASTFVLRHEDGRRLQIGRNCLTDFLGSAEDIQRYTLAAEWLATAMAAAEADEESCGGGRAQSVWMLPEFLTVTWACVRAFGWASKASVVDGKIATVYRVEAHLDRRPMKDIPPIPTPTDADIASAEATIAFIEATDEQSEFMENLRVICRLGYVKERHAGLTAAMVMVHDRDNIRAMALVRAANNPSAFVGTVGERSVYTLTVTGKPRMLESEYGMTTIVRFADEAGNDYVWFGSGDLAETYADGTAHTVKATVKKHDTDRFTKRPTTYLSRVAEYVAPTPKVRKPRAKKGAEA